MSLASLTRTDFATARGTIPLWHAPGALQSTRPVVVTVTGAFAPADTMSRTQSVLGEACDCFLMHLPGNHAPPLREASVPAFASGLDEVIGQAFPDRPVLLLGVSIGALVVLAARAPNIVQVTAVEPPLLTGKLWPMLDALAEKLAAAPDDRELHAFVDGVFGVTPSGRRDIDYRPLFDELAVPVDVIVGARPLMPERSEETYPSFVDAPERAWLAARPNTRLHVAPGAGHNVPFQAPHTLTAVLTAALADVRPARSAVADALVSRAPLTARRVLYVGAGAAAFRQAYGRRNPTAEVRSAATLGEATGGPFDLAVLESLSSGDRERLAGLTAEGGAVLAHVPPADALALDDAPFAMVRMTLPAAGEAAFDDTRVDLWPGLRAAMPEGGPHLLALARKAAPAPPLRLRLRLATFAPTLMDVRTRLPAQGLRTDPELSVVLSGPDFQLEDPGVETPKLVVLQRTALSGEAAWRTSMADSLRKGWVVVMEFDDHPDLIAEMAGVTPSEEGWRRFGYVHAVQTSTPKLAEAFRRYNPDVRVFPNCAFEIEPRPVAPAPRRVFYGAALRGPFAMQVATSLGPAADAFPEVEWLVVGDRAVFEALPAARKQFIPYLPYADYLRVMGTCALSLSPIEGHGGRDTKSDLKWVEGAARGVVTVGSPPIYGDTVRHRENGLLVERIEDWAPLVAEALGDEGFRLRMAQQAWAEVRDTRMFAQQAAARRAWYQDLWARRAALDEGVMQRLPGLREALGR